MGELKTFRLAAGSSVVSLRGELDGPAAAELAGAIEQCRGAVVVDLLRAQFVDLDVVDALVAATDGRTTFVAQRPLRDAFELVGLHRAVHLEATLVAALA